MKLDELKNKIKDWSFEREIHNADPAKQMLKLFEECGELAGGIAKNKPEAIKDGIGDVFVVLTILAQQLGFDLTECVSEAYNEIAQRKGKMINGVFVKESDIK